MTSKPEIPTRTGGPLVLTNDFDHHYFGYDAAGGRCRVSVYQDPRGERIPTIVCSDRYEHFAAGIGLMAEHIAAELGRHLFPERLPRVRLLETWARRRATAANENPSPPFYWIERFPKYDKSRVDQHTSFVFFDTYVPSGVPTDLLLQREAKTGIPSTITLAECRDGGVLKGRSSSWESHYGCAPTEQQPRIFWCSSR